jgi:hypothetical protein
MIRSASPIRRRGISLIEVVVVMAVLVVIGGILAPTFRTMSGDSKTKAGVDTIKGRIADARGSAVDQGRPYKLSISQDGLHVRVAPDEQAFVNMAATADDDESSGPHIVESDMPKDVTLKILDQDATENTTDEAGWIRVATFLPDGTCREDSALLEVHELGVPAVNIRIRGLTGTATTETTTGARP